MCLLCVFLSYSHLIFYHNFLFLFHIYSLVLTSWRLSSPSWFALLPVVYTCTTFHITLVRVEISSKPRIRTVFIYLICDSPTSVATGIYLLLQPLLHRAPLEFHKAFPTCIQSSRCENLGGFHTPWSHPDSWTLSFSGKRNTFISTGNRFWSTLSMLPPPSMVHISNRLMERPLDCISEG